MINFTFEDTRQYKIVTWEGLLAGEDAVWSEVVGLRISVQLAGEFDGGSVTIEGSNSKSFSPCVLRDFEGLQAVVKSPGIVTLGDACRLIRPCVRGSAKMKLQATLFCWKGNV